MNTKEEILQTGLWKLMFKMSLPGIWGMLMVSVNTLVDAVYVSQLVGNIAFGGVSLSMPLFTVNAAVTAMFSSGASALYSRAIGETDLQLRNQLFAHLTILVVLASLVLGLAGIWLAVPALTFLGADQAMMHYGKPFFQLAMAGGFSSMMGLTSSALIRAEGNVRFAMKITAIAVALNILINPILIKTFHLGVRGSAMATIISMGIYTFLNIRYFYRGKGYLDLKQKWSFQPNLLLRILQTGLPSFFMQINGFFRQFILFKLVADYSGSALQLTAFTAIYRLFSFSAIPVFGMLQAFSPVVGINLGAGQKERVREAVSVFRTGAVVLLLILALPGFLFPRTMLSLLVPDAVLPDDLVFYFRTVLLALPLMPFASTSIVFLQVSKNSRIASRLTFSRELFIFLPVIFCLTHFKGYAGIYYGLLLENLLYMLLVYLVTRKIMTKELDTVP